MMLLFFPMHHNTSSQVLYFSCQTPQIYLQFNSVRKHQLFFIQKRKRVR